MGIANQAHVAKSCSLVCVFFIQRAWFARGFGQWWAPATCSEICCSLDHCSHTERHLQARLLRGYRFFFFCDHCSIVIFSSYFASGLYQIVTLSLVQMVQQLPLQHQYIRSNGMLFYNFQWLNLSCQPIFQHFPIVQKENHDKVDLSQPFFFFFCMHYYVQTHGQLHSVQLVVPKKKKKKNRIINSRGWPHWLIQQQIFFMVSFFSVPTPKLCNLCQPTLPRLEILGRITITGGMASSVNLGQYRIKLIVFL